MENKTKYFILGLLSIQVLLSQPKVDIQFSVVGTSASFIVIDKWQHRTGEDPRGGGITYTEIPGANYSTDNAGDDDLWYNEFEYEFVSSKSPNILTISVIGKKLSKFNLNVGSFPDDQNYSSLNTSVNLFLDQNAEQSYNFTYYGTIGYIPKLEKIITPQTLVQDLTAGGKLNLIGDQSFVSNLMTSANKVITGINSGDKAYAKKYLDVVNSAVINAYTTPTSSKFVDSYAYPIVMEDINKIYQTIGPVNPPQQQSVKKQP